MTINNINANMKIICGHLRQLSTKLTTFAPEFEAQMAELVDALVSGTSVSNDVQVRVLFWAPQKSTTTTKVGCSCALKPNHGRATTDKKRHLRGQFSERGQMPALRQT